MPDVKVYLPESVHTNNEFVEGLKERLRKAVAKHLSCLDDDGEEMVLKPDEVDVLPLSKGTHSSTGARILVEVQAYGLEDRMKNIKERLQGILDDSMIESNIFPPRQFQRMASITFIPLPRGCWLSTVT